MRTAKFLQMLAFLADGKARSIRDVATACGVTYTHTRTELRHLEKAGKIHAHGYVEQEGRLGGPQKMYSIRKPPAVRRPPRKKPEVEVRLDSLISNWARMPRQKIQMTVGGQTSAYGINEGEIIPQEFDTEVRYAKPVVLGNPLTWRTI